MLEPLLVLPNWQRALSVRAERALEANLAELDRGIFLTGNSLSPHRFSLRDFCFAVPGLLSLGWTDLVERQLLLYLSFLELGHLPTELKLSSETGSWFHRGSMNQLRPVYTNAHGVHAADANLLFLQAWASLVEEGGSWNPVAGAVPELLQPYTKFVAQGELSQEPYADWSEVSWREGSALWLHLLFGDVCYELLTADLLPAPFLLFRSELRSFLQRRRDPDSGLFREHKQREIIALDSQLQILRSRYFSQLTGEKDALGFYHRLRASPLWQSPSGAIAWPKQRAQDRWTWLLAESALAAARVCDRGEAARLLGEVEALRLSRGFPEHPARSTKLLGAKLTDRESSSRVAAKCIEALAALQTSPDIGWESS